MTAKTMQLSQGQSGPRRILGTSLAARPSLGTPKTPEEAKAQKLKQKKKRKPKKKRKSQR